VPSESKRIACQQQDTQPEKPGGKGLPADILVTASTDPSWTPLFVAITQYKAGEVVQYRSQFPRDEYQGVVLGPANQQPDPSEPTYLLTLLSGPYAGQTSTVYERELRPGGIPTRPSEV
jgi:hypothetical protein